MQLAALSKGVICGGAWRSVYEQRQAENELDGPRRTKRRKEGRTRFNSTTPGGRKERRGRTKRLADTSGGGQELILGRKYVSGILGWHGDRCAHWIMVITASFIPAFQSTNHCHRFPIPSVAALPGQSHSAPQGPSPKTGCPLCSCSPPPCSLAHCVLPHRSAVRTSCPHDCYHHDFLPLLCLPSFSLLVVSPITSHAKISSRCTSIIPHPSSSVHWSWTPS